MSRSAEEVVVKHSQVHAANQAHMARELILWSEDSNWVIFNQRQAAAKALFARQSYNAYVLANKKGL